jgi:hypothetical protein
MTDTRDVSLNSDTQVLASTGSTRRTAWGNTISRIVCQRVMRNENTPAQTVSHTYDHELAIRRPLDTKNANGGAKNNSIAPDVRRPPQLRTG